MFGSKRNSYAITNRYLPLIGGVFIQLCTGIIYIWSIFQIPVVQHYNWSISNTAYVFSIMMASYVLGIIIGGKINNGKNSQFIIFCGGFLFALGMFLTSHVPRNMPWLIYIFYGLIAGFGAGIAYIASISCTQRWWINRKGLASGVIVGAFGASTVIFAPLMNYLISPNVLGVVKTFRFLSVGFIFIILIFIWLIKDPPKEYYKRFKKEQLPDESDRQYSSFEMIKTKQFYILLLCIIFLTSAFYILNPLLKSLGELRGLSESAAVAGVMVTGIASALGRLLMPILSDSIGRKNVFLILFIITIISSIFLTFARGYLFIILIFLIAFAYGGSAGVTPPLVSDYFGVKNLGSNLGFVMVAVLISVLSFPKIANIVSIDDFPAASIFIIPITACVAGILLIVILKPPKNK